MKANSSAIFQRVTMHTNRKNQSYLILIFLLNIFPILYFQFQFKVLPKFELYVNVEEQNFTLPDFLFHKYKIYSNLWKELSLYKSHEIKHILNILFPNVANHHNKNNPLERELFFDKTIKIFNEYVDMHKDWPDESYNWEPPSNQKVGKYVIPGMKDVQHIIWKHQHPIQCRDKKFLSEEVLIGGFGSNLHVFSTILADALDEDKILIFSENNLLWENGPYCHEPISDYQKEYIEKLQKRKRTAIPRNITNIKQKTNGYDCFFSPLTNCSLYDNLTVEIRRGFIRAKPIPQIILPIVKRLKIPENLYYFYWRLCAITYFVRYNEIAKSWMKELEEDFLVNPVDEYDVSIYVRHGDKFFEMALVENQQYVGALNVIQKILKKDKLNVFLSTEDPKTIQWFINNTNFSLTYFDFELGNYNLDYAVTLGNILTRQMLANLKHSLFSTFVIGTLSSNWNRIIQELRMTTAGYANSYYFEVGDHACVSLEHCKLIGEKFHMNW